MELGQGGEMGKPLMHFPLPQCLSVLRCMRKHAATACVVSLVITPVRASVAMTCAATSSLHFGLRALFKVRLEWQTLCPLVVHRQR